MNVRRANLLCVIALAAMLIGVVFTAILLICGTISECFSGSENDLGSGIGAACSAIFIIFFIFLAIISEVAALFIGGTTVFSGKRKLSVTVGTTFVVILCVCSVLLYIASTVTVFSGGGDKNAITLMTVAFLFNVVASVFCIFAFSLAGAEKNKAINAKKNQPAEFESVESDSSDKNETDDYSDAEEARYSSSSDGEEKN